MPSDTLEILREVNDDLRSATVRLSPVRTHCSTIGPQDLSDILSQILRAETCLKRSSESSEDERSEEASAVEQQKLEYRSNLEKLKQFLPDLQVRLLAEKSRLETAKAHLAATESWARANR